MGLPKSSEKSAIYSKSKLLEFNICAILRVVMSNMSNGWPFLPTNNVKQHWHVYPWWELSRYNYSLKAETPKTSINLALDLCLFSDS